VHKRLLAVVAVAIAAVLIPIGQLQTATAASSQGKAPATTASSGGYTPVTPYRVCDTRPPGGSVGANQCDNDSTGAGSGPISQGAARVVTIEGKGPVPPTGVTAVVVNVTAVAPSKNTYLSVYPDGVTPPGTSNLNPNAGAVLANLVEVGVGADGKIDVYNNMGSTNAILDVEGYVTAAATALYTSATTPVRICDTRAAGGGIAANRCDINGLSPIGANQTRTFAVTGSDSPVPATATAVVFNLTAIGPTISTVLTAFAGGISKPNASNLNVAAHVNLPNRVIVPVTCVGTTCTVSIWNSVGSVNIAVDVDGWYSTTGAQFTALSTPARVCDTHGGTANCPNGLVAGGQVLNVGVAGVDGIPFETGSAGEPVAIVANVTAFSATASTYVTVFPGPSSPTHPPVSDINAGVGDVATNLVVVGVGSDGSINLYNNVGGINLIVDVVGYYSTGSSGPLTAPTFTSTLVGPGQADMYPVDVTNDAQYYFVLDAGNYRIIAVNRTTNTIDCQEGGLQGNGDSQMGDARALEYDPANNELFLADTPNNRIVVFSFSASACAANSPTAFTYLSQFGSRGVGPEQFNQVYGVAVDAVNGWVYAVDGSGRVEKSDLTGNFLSQFNAGGTLNAPRQVTVAPNGDVLVMDARNHQCDVFNDSGTLLFTVGNGLGTGPGQFTDDPRGVAVSADGTLAFITDAGGKRVEVFNLQSSGGDYTGWTFAYTIPSAVSGPGQFVGPRGLTTTSDNHLVLTDEWGFNLHEIAFTSTGVTSEVDTTPTAPPVPGVNSPRGVHVAANGQIYISDYWNQRVEYMNPNGTGAASFGFRGNPNQSGAINFAWDAAIQPVTGDIFVANRENDQIAAFSPTGAPLIIFGSNGSGTQQFSFPQGIAFAPDGTLLVDDSGNDRIQRFTLSDNDTKFTYDATYGQSGAGSTSPAGDLNNPTGISVAPDGTIWVADTLNNRIQSVSPTGVWGVPITKPIGTGVQMPFSVPWGVTVAPDGSIWVSDTGNNRIVSMDTSGNLIFNANEQTMGIPATSQDTFIYPFAIAFSGDTVYMSDIWNNRVLVLTTS
jgi:sugar lactone lactonase YvrE